MSEKKKVPEIRFPEFSVDWEEKKLGDIGKTFTGLSGKSKEDFGHGEARFVTYMNVFSNTISDLNGIENVEIDVKQNEVQYGDIFFTTSSETLNEVGMSSVWFGCQNNIYLNSFCFGFRPESKYNSYYLGFMLRSPIVRKKFKLLGQGISRYNISKNRVMEMILNFPSLPEQQKIGNFFKKLDDSITLQKKKIENLKLQKKGLLQKMFPKNGETVPEVRFPEFSGDWEEKKLGDLLFRVNERNNGQFNKDRWISVANMYFQKPDKVLTNNIDTRTYVMRFGDISFEGHSNSIHTFGRFVLNDIGDGVVSELFPIYRFSVDYDYLYWKFAIKIENIMFPIFSKSLTSSGNSSNKLNDNHFFRQFIKVPTLPEQQKIGNFFKKLDELINLNQRKLENLEKRKKGLLQKMFV